MLQRLGFAEKGRGAMRRARSCACALSRPIPAAMPRTTPCRRSSLPGLQYTGVRRTHRCCPQNLVQKKQRIVARWIKALKNRNSAVRKNAHRLGNSSPRARSRRGGRSSDRDEIVRALCRRIAGQDRRARCAALDCALKHNDPSFPRWPPWP